PISTRCSGYWRTALEMLEGGRCVSSHPEGWESVPLEQLTSPSAPICYGVLKPGPDVPRGVPMLRVKDLQNDRVRTSELYHITHELDAEFRRTKLKGADVLISVQG